MHTIAGKGSYYGMAHRSTNQYANYISTTDFQAGRVYRVLSPNDREQGGYYLIRRGGVLSNEFFSESQQRRSWTESRYQCYLAAKRVDRVVVERAYRNEFPTNEPAMLDSLVSRGLAQVTYTGSRSSITVYDVTAFRNSRPAPASVKECRVA